MNNKRREALQGVYNALDMAEDRLSVILDEEQNCLDNMPENLEYSDRYEKMENAIENIESAIEKISDAKNYIEEAQA